jgi:hypothetical protein
MNILNLLSVMYLLCFLLAFAAHAFVVWPAHAAEPTTTPILLLETGMHTAPIRQIATDAQGRWLVTASDDKMAIEGEGGHGVFTSALLEGLRGAVDRNHNGAIEVGELADYIEETIPQITQRKWKYEQFPYRELQGASFSILETPKR